MNKEQAEEMLELLKAIKNNTGLTFLVVSVIGITIVALAFFRSAGHF